MGEDICYSYMRLGVNVEDIKLIYTTQRQKQTNSNKNPGKKNKQRT